MRWIALGPLAALAIAAPRTAAADRPASTGPYAEAGIGATTMLGQDRRYSALGPGFALRGGLDLFSWFSIGARLDMSTHEATVPPPPEGEYFQLYGAAAEGRLTVRFGPVAVFADGGLGLTMISTNVLGKVGVLDPGERFSPIFSAGGGLEYQLQNRHFALGLGAQWNLMPAFDAMQTVASRAYLRYTY